MQENKTLNLIAQAIYDKKGFNLIVIDVREQCSFTDYFVIAEGNVERHVQSLANEVERTLRKAGERPAYVEGLSNGDWVVMDYSNVILHLFKPSLREFYNLEGLWSGAKVVHLDIEEAS